MYNTQRHATYQSALQENYSIQCAAFEVLNFTFGKSRCIMHNIAILIELNTILCKGLMIQWKLNQVDVTWCARGVTQRI